MNTEKKRSKKSDFRDSIRRMPPINSLMFGCYLLLAILAYTRPGRILNEIIVLLSIVLVLDGIYFFIVAPYVKITLCPKIISEVGQVFTQTIEVSNTAYLPSVYIYLISGTGKRIDIEKQQCIGILLGARESLEQDISYKANYSGIEQIALERVIIRSFLGFFRKSFKLETMTTVEILPEIKHLNYMEHFNDFLGRMTIGEGWSSGQEDIQDIGDEVGYELRPYVEGDSERLIHWKIAAFKEEYLVREREKNKAQKRELFFILNPFMTKAERNEDDEESLDEIIEQNKVISSFASLVAYYLSKGQSVRVAYYKEKQWQYMKLKAMGQIRYLQECLSDYECMYVEDTINQRGIIKNLLSITRKRVGIKVIVSGYWEQELEMYALTHKLRPRSIPVIWTGSQLPHGLVGKSHFSFWHMTDEYGLILAEKTKLGGSYEET